MCVSASGCIHLHVCMHMGVQMYFHVEAPEEHPSLSCPSLHYIFKLSLSIRLRNHLISTSLGSQSSPET